MPTPVLNARSSVVRIETTIGQDLLSGSGFVVSNGKDGTFIATNYHVIEDWDAISVWLSADDLVPAKVVTADRNRDLAVIRLEARRKALKPLPLSNKGKQGMAVYALGFPGAADWLTDSYAVSSEEITITDGLVSATRNTKLESSGPHVDFFQINVAINPGNSGGPLLDSRGRVIGINTLTILESDGIGGAVAVSELITLLRDGGISYSRGGMGWLLPAIGGAVLLTACLFLLIKRGGSKKTVRGPKKAQTLEAYLSGLTRSLTPQEAVSLLMPVFITVRDQNQAGRLLQKLSPLNIVIKGQAASLDLNRLAQSPLTLQFAAPEQKETGTASQTTDIYALSTILSTMIQPRAVGELSTADAAFLAILEKGMAARPEDRYPSMQELIFALAPYNTQAVLPADSTADPSDPEKPKTERKRLSFHWKKAYTRRLCIALPALALIAVLGHCIATYSLAMSAMKNVDVLKAADYVEDMWFTKLLKEDDWGYLSAAIHTKNGHYTKAQELLLYYLDYQNSNELVTEVLYQKALASFNCGNYTSASSAFKSLDNYKDSFDYYQSATYKLAMESIDSEDEITAYKILETISGYKDTDDLLDVLLDIIYLKGIQSYRNSSYPYVSAKNNFDFVYKKNSTYERVRDYLFLCNIASGWSGGNTDTLLELVGFENANELILKQQNTAEEFLKGNWKGDGKYFRIDDEGDSRYDLPFEDWGYYYFFKDGWYTLENKAKSETRKTAQFTIINKNTIQVYCLKNSKTYTLYRQ